MKDSEIRPGERVKDVHLNEDTLSVDLIDARTIIVPLMWYPRLFPPRSRLGLNVPSARCVARSAERAMVFTGRTLMKTSVPRDSSEVHLPQQDQ